MRISDWSSDVCSSDLVSILAHRLGRQEHDCRQHHRPKLFASGQIRQFEHCEGRPDLQSGLALEKAAVSAAICKGTHRDRERLALDVSGVLQRRNDPIDRTANAVRFRSEEHTSEIKSLMRISYAVFCLKKKNTRHQP